ncbi:MAG: AmmeMemoRadiSam system protein B [Proteobacteria bacterium]|nr:AmmeMemoRadiSam system protein B [Pseudomonadota bacterium]
MVTLRTRPDIRRPAVAGTFYPAEPGALAAEVEGLLRGAKGGAGAEARDFVALIAPHAGYVYSGAVAASAYARLARHQPKFHKVVLIGPDHHVGFGGLAASSARAFETPLGLVPQYRAGVDRALELPQVKILDEAHVQEHSLEVHLPFLQKVLGDFEVVALVAGQASPEEVSQVFDVLLGENEIGDETLLVVSTDLSHYLDYKTAGRSDAATVEAICQFNEDGVGDRDACGRVPVRGLMHWARQRGLRAEALDVRNSGDTAGDKSRVVGYASVIFTRGDGLGLGEAARASLLEVADGSLRHGALKGEPLPIFKNQYSTPLGDPGASFVTLTLDGRLRGCIGSLSPERPLVEDVAVNAFASAFADPRFSAIEAHEIERLGIEISVLGPARPLAADSEADLLAALRPAVDGLILRCGENRATFLPQVWSQLPEPADFLRQLKQKAGLDAGYWSEDLQFWRYITESFSREVLGGPSPRQ